MAVEVAGFLRERVLDSLNEIQPKLPADRLSTEFQRIKDCIDNENEQESNKTLWSSAAACTDLLRYLYDLNDVLADCRNLFEQSQERSESVFSFIRFQQTYIPWSLYILLQLGPIRVGFERLISEHQQRSPSVMTIFPTGRHTSFECNAGPVIEFGEQEKQIKALLTDEGYKAIGLYGMSGSGKSALMQKVLQSPPVQFSKIISVCLSNIRSVKDEEIESEMPLEDEGEMEVKIVRQMLCELGIDVDKWTIINPGMTVLLENLKVLLTTEKYLIVLDDVWRMNEFYSGLGDAAPGAHTIGNRLSDALPRDGGGKIIITTSLKEVAQKVVHKKNLIYMKPVNRGSPIVGFDKQEEEIKALLSDDGCKVIGICGISGSGKTTLVHKVLNSHYKVFSPVIWVCLSDINSKDDKDIEVQILKHMLCELGIDVDRWMTVDHGETSLLGILKNSLMSKKYLIVFDDAWEKLDFYANLGDASPVIDTAGNRLSEALPRDAGGKIIVTSRRREVAKMMVGQQKLIHMKPLDTESCRFLLEAGSGFLQYAAEIESLLTDGGFVAIGIHGPSNSANTALIHKVLSSPSIGGKLQSIVWVCESNISPSRTEKGIRSDILEYILKELKLKYDFNESTRSQSESDELLGIVKSSLLSKKPYMIVLADLGKNNDGDGDLGNNRTDWIWLIDALRQNGDGTVIVTSGIKEVAQEMVGEHNLIHVRLPELATKKTSEVTIHRQYITDEIVDQCHGLPLGAMTLGRIIRYKGLEI